MSTEHPGAARLAYWRLRTASGVTRLEDLEQQVAVVAEAVGENHDLAGPLADLVSRVEAMLVPALERRERAGQASGGGEPSPRTVSEDEHPGSPPEL